MNLQSPEWGGARYDNSGAKRPKIKKAHLSVALPPYTEEILRDFQRATGKTLSQIVTEALDRHLFIQ